jgi:hypothetical protein
MFTSVVNMKLFEAYELYPIGLCLHSDERVVIVYMFRRNIIEAKRTEENGDKNYFIQY